MSRLIEIARPPFLIVGMTLFLLGSLWAVLLGAIFSPSRLLFGYLVILPAQLSVHFGNDYFDMASDRPGRSMMISEGSGVLIEHTELRPNFRPLSNRVWWQSGQNVQDLLLNRAWFGVMNFAAAIWVSRYDDGVILKGFEQFFCRWIRIVTVLWHQAFDKFLGLGNILVNVMLNESRD